MIIHTMEKHHDDVSDLWVIISTVTDGDTGKILSRKAIHVTGLVFFIENVQHIPAVEPEPLKPWNSIGGSDLWG